MPERQLTLFPHAKPLLGIFDQAFFRSVPRKPGVYVMSGKSENVLYVGQSGNLRQRLATYKNCNPHQLSRRIIRLLHQVERITWEICETPRAARLRENELLRLYRPKFNVVNVYPQAYAFIGTRQEGAQMDLWFTRQLPTHPGTYGAFKGMARDAFAALTRNLWAVVRQPLSIHEFPCGLWKPPRHFTLHGDADRMKRAGALTRDFLGGHSPGLVDWLAESLPSQGNPAAFEEQFHAADLALLSQFFHSGPQRNYRLRQEHGLQEQLILQEKLDDLIVSSGPMVLSD